MRVYTIEQKQSQTTLQANLKVVLSISCDTSSNSYSSKNTVDIDEDKINSIKIGGNFIAYLTTDGQVFAVYYNVRESSTPSSTLPSARIDIERKSRVRPRSPQETGGRMKYRKRTRVDSLLSDIINKYQPSEDNTSTWSASPSSSPTKGDVPGDDCDLLGKSSEKSKETDKCSAGKGSSSKRARRQLSGSILGPMSDQVTDSLDTAVDSSDIEIQDTINSSEHMSSAEVYLSEYYTNVSRFRSDSQSTETKEGDLDPQEMTSRPEVVTSRPEVSQPVQWLNSCDSSLYFTMIAATKCAVLLVCSNGQLWRWDMLDNRFEEHPLYKMYCGEKAVVKIHSSNLRITVLLETGEIAVFYDNFTSGSSQPMIISELSHPAEHIPCLESETVLDIKSGDFISAVLTESGKLFWWGMLHKEVSSPGSSKTKTASSSTSSIKSGSQVVLKNKVNDILIGSLVYTTYPQSKLGRVEGCNGNSVVVRLCDRTTSPNPQKPKVETWSHSQIVVLETTLVPLGTVIGLHGTNAIMMTSRHSDPLMFRNEWKQYRRMFSEGQLDKLDEDVEMEPTSRPPPPTTDMEVDGSSVASDASQAGNSGAYPNLCVYPVSELEVYETGGSTHNIQKVPRELLATANLQEFEAMSFSIDHIGNLTVLGRNKATNNVYMLTRDMVSEDGEAIQAADSQFIRDKGKLSMLSSPDVVMVVDNNNVPFVPPLPTCLNYREFNYLPSLNAIDLKQEISTLPGRSRLIVAVAKRPQIIMSVILQGDLKYLTQLQQLGNSSSSSGGGGGGGGKLSFAKPSLDQPTWSRVKEALEKERDACGRSCLHVCAIAKPNPKNKQKKPPPITNSLLPIRVDDSYFHSITLIKRSCSFEELRFRHYTVERQKELKEHDRWLNVMKFICNIEGVDLHSLLTLTDNAGYTPFMAAIASKNYNNAWYLLPLIMGLEQQHPGITDQAVWKPLQFNTTVYHLLAQGLLHTALIIQQIPSWCTESTLYNLFTQNYPSIYKVLIQQKPKNMVKSVGRRLFDSSKPMTVRDRILRSFMVRSGPGSGGGASSTSSFKYNSKQQQGIIFFSNPEEARRALIQMEGYVIPAKSSGNRGGRASNFLSYSNPGGFFEVSIRFVAREVRGFFLTKSKKKKSRVKEEYESNQESYRKMLMESLLKSYKGDVNELCETPLATFVNESIFDKLEDKKKTDKNLSAERFLPFHSLERGLGDTPGGFSARSSVPDCMMTSRRPRLSQRTIQIQGHRADLGDRYSPSNNSGPSSYTSSFGVLPSPYNFVVGPIGSYYPSNHTIDRIIVNRSRTSDPEVGNDRSSYSISSDIEEEDNPVSLPSLPSTRYFEDLQDGLVTGMRVREEELSRRETSDMSIFGPSSSRWPEIRRNPISDDMFLPFDGLLPTERSPRTISRVLEENLAFALSVMPSSSSSSLPTASSCSSALPSCSSALPSCSSALPSCSSALPSSSSHITDDSSQTIKPESPEIEDPDYSSPSSSLDSVPKQLCANETVVITTIYCCYSNQKILPDDLRFEKPDEESPTGRRKLKSEGDIMFTEAEIEDVLDRVDNLQYHAGMTGFIHNLISNTENGPDIACTLNAMLDRGDARALFVTTLFVRSLVRYLTLQLTNIGPRECLKDMVEFRLAIKTTKLLQSFGWLSVREILTSAEAVFLPLQYNNFKSQTHSTVMEHHIFPHPPGFIFPTSASQAILLHPLTYMRNCPLMKDKTQPTKQRRKLSLIAEPHLPGGEEDEISGDELTDEESIQDESSHSFLSQINFLDVVDTFFNANPPQATPTEEDPYLMWAVDGQTTTFRPVFRAQHSAEELTLLKENNNERGKNVLSCVYSRLAKTATDIASKTTSNMFWNVKSSCESLLQAAWSWLFPSITSLESQFIKAGQFDLNKYMTMLKQGERKIRTLYNPGSVNKSTITASFSQEYIMYLLDSHSNTSSASLPIIDIKSYKHIVYVFDVMYYVISHWPRTSDLPASTRCKDPSKIVSPTFFLKRSPSLDFCDENIVTSPQSGTNKDLERSVDVQLPLALQPHLLTPMASRESLFSTVCVSEQKEKVRSWKGKESLKQALRHRSNLMDLNPAEFLSQFECTTRVFSTYYLGEGPGIEKDSILNLKAGYSGKTARFLRQIKEVKLLVQSQNRHEMRDIPARIYNLHIYVNRNRLLTDSIKCLLEMSHFHPVNYSVKFEGEEGGGPGVNRGWFSVVSGALKDKSKYPDKTIPLFHLPGRLPEQSENMSPQPWVTDLYHQNSGLYKQRLDGFRACGRFFGLALWFKQTLPLKLCRHVWKFLLGRRLCWADLAFYNSDLYEGLRAMLNDAKWMTSDEFLEVYPCTFEVEVNGKLRKLKPGGDEIPLTKQNVEEYIQGYSELLMVYSVEEELGALKQGFTDIIPNHVLEGLTAEDLTLLLSGGSGDISFEKLYSIITFINSIGCSQKRLDQFKKWFWKIVKDMTQAERQQLLYFATGSSTLPPHDHSTERSRDRISITVDIQQDSRNALPMSSTCGQRISIPLYRSYSMLKSKLSTALQCLSYGLG